MTATTGIPTTGFLRHEDEVLSGRVEGESSIGYALGLGYDGEPIDLRFYAQSGTPHVALTGEGSEDSARALIVQLAGNNGPDEVRISVLGTDDPEDMERVDVVDEVIPADTDRFVARAHDLAGSALAEIERRRDLLAQNGLTDVHDARYRALVLSMREGMEHPSDHELYLPYEVLVVEGSVLNPRPDDSAEQLAERVLLMRSIARIAAEGGDLGFVVVIVSDSLHTVPATIIAHTHVVRLGDPAQSYAQFTLNRNETATALARTGAGFKA